MSTNLVSAVTQILRPDIVARVASLMGLDRELVERAFRAGIPCLLAALTSLVSKPAGADTLYRAVSQQELGALSSLVDLLGGNKRAAAVVVRGATGLTALLGETTVSALTGSVSRYAGLGIGTSKCLMGLLGPIVLSVLEQQRRAKGLDAENLGQLITSQKDYVVHALPDSVADHLRDAGMLDHASVPTARAYPPQLKPAYASPQRGPSSLA